MSNKDAAYILKKYLEWVGVYNDWRRSPIDRPQPVMDGYPTEEGLSDALKIAIDCLNRKQLSESEILSLVLDSVDAAAMSDSNILPVIFKVVRSVEKTHNIGGN